VVAFTATQIPDIAGRRYPAELAEGLSDGIPILAEETSKKRSASRRRVAGGRLIIDVS